jgi:chorismate synthase
MAMSRAAWSASPLAQAAEARMAGNTFGHALRVTSFGESHGPAVGCVVDGCPAGVPLSPERIADWLARRRPGGPLQSPRAEADLPQVLSGVLDGLTLGTPIAVTVANVDQRSADYAALAQQARAGHADFTWQARFGVRDPRGGGRASARETVGRVIAGAVAEAVLEAWAQGKGRPQVQVVAWVQAVGEVVATGPAPSEMRGLPWTRTAVEASPVRCPDGQASAAMVAAIEVARARHDSLGGVVRCVATGLPAGWGDPVFDKLTGLLGHALHSLPAVRGVQFGTGFDAARMTGAQHNDPWLGPGLTASNHHGGVLGGLSSGMPLVLDVAFKPASTIAQPQQGLGADGQPVPLTVQGRHDPCVVPRAVAIVEAAVWHVLADALLRPARLGGL